MLICSNITTYWVKDNHFTQELINTAFVSNYSFKKHICASKSHKYAWTVNIDVNSLTWYIAHTKTAFLLKNRLYILGEFSHLIDSNPFNWVTNFQQITFWSWYESKIVFIHNNLNLYFVKANVTCYFGIICIYFLLNITIYSNYGYIMHGHESYKILFQIKIRLKSLLEYDIYKDWLWY